MAEIPKGGLVKDAYKPICRDCADNLTFLQVGHLETISTRV